MSEVRLLGSISGHPRRLYICLETRDRNESPLIISTLVTDHSRAFCALTSRAGCATQCLRILPAETFLDLKTFVCNPGEHHHHLFESLEKRNLELGPEIVRQRAREVGAAMDRAGVETSESERETADPNTEHEKHPQNDCDPSAGPLPMRFSNEISAKCSEFGNFHESDSLRF